jgi:hypothetical protein
VRWRPDRPSIYLPNSGQIDLNAIGVEAGQANNSQTALNDAAVRDMIGKSSGAQNAMNEYYGASSSLIDITAEACVASEWGSGTTNSEPGSAANGDGPGWGEIMVNNSGGMYACMVKAAGKSGNVLVKDERYVATWTVQVYGTDDRNLGCFFGVQYGCDLSRGHLGYQRMFFYRKGGEMAKLWEQNTIGGMPTSWVTKSGVTEFTCDWTGPCGIQFYSGQNGATFFRNYSISISKK